MTSIDEKRVYADREGGTELLLASSVGVVAVDVSDDLVGRFGVEHRCVARDVATGEGRVAVATDEDALVDLDATGFGPAVAVGVHGGAPLAAGEDGRVARHDDGWETLGRVEDPRALDGPLVAAADGVYRVGDGLDHAGLADVRDVAGAGRPLAATGEAVYALGNGWMDELDGTFDVVAAAPDGRAHAVRADGALFARPGPGGEWTRVEVPGDERVADVCYPRDAVAAVTRGGTVLVDAGEGWRSRSVGVRDVGGVAVR